MRRPGVMALAERFDVDRRAVRRMQRIGDRYGAGPLELRIPGRSIALVLDAAHVLRILGQTPEPFATREKIASLAHSEPKGVLISHDVDPADQRTFNEEA